MQIHSVGIDLGKTTFHLVALCAAGKVLLRKKFTRRQLITFIANMQCSLIGMEAVRGSLRARHALREDPNQTQSGRTRSATHHGQEARLSTQRPNTFAQTGRSPFAFPLQSRGGPYISGASFSQPGCSRASRTYVWNGRELWQGEWHRGSVL